MSTQRWVTAPPENPARAVTKSLCTDDSPMTDSLYMLPRWLAACGHRPSAGPGLLREWKISMRRPLLLVLPV